MHATLYAPFSAAAADTRTDMRRAPPAASADAIEEDEDAGDAAAARPMLCCTPVMGELIAQRRAPRRAGAAALGACRCKNCILSFCTND
jgi:hypothetical protein